MCGLRNGDTVLGTESSKTGTSPNPWWDSMSSVMNILEMDQAKLHGMIQRTKEKAKGGRM
ncbi:hypothetical protein P7K49_035736, partial [Saguinus oedipus]